MDKKHYKTATERIDACKAKLYEDEIGIQYMGMETQINDHKQ